MAENNTPFNELNMMASRNRYPRISWLQEAWLSTINRYERIAMASPRIGVAILGQELVQHHINLLPTLSSPADFSPVFDDAGEYVGSRPKTPTWPMTRQEAMRNRHWEA